VQEREILFHSKYNRKPASNTYSQNLWINLCFDCFIYRLPAVFIQVLLNCTKTHQTNKYTNYQYLMIAYWILNGSLKGNAKSLIVIVGKY